LPFPVIINRLKLSAVVPAALLQQITTVTALIYGENQIMIFIYDLALDPVVWYRDYSV
jgi:hypothetical protein